MAQRVRRKFRDRIRSNPKLRVGATYGTFSIFDLRIDMERIPLEDPARDSDSNFIFEDARYYAFDNSINRKAACSTTNISTLDAMQNGGWRCH